MAGIKTRWCERFNESNEKIGDINEVILDKSGKVANVILGVGGFPGVGEHYVAGRLRQVKMGERTRALDHCLNLNRVCW